MESYLSRVLAMNFLTKIFILEERIHFSLPAGEAYLWSQQICFKHLPEEKTKTNAFFEKLRSSTEKNI